MTIILHPDTIHEMAIWVTESGIQLRFEAQSGDKCFLELGDELVGYIIEQLVYYAWNMTVEEAFGFNNEKGKETSLHIDDPDLPNIPF